jgi:hypothetical protein
MKQFELPFVQKSRYTLSRSYFARQGLVKAAEERERMFPWYVDTALVFLVLAGFWGVWTSPGR